MCNKYGIYDWVVMHLKFLVFYLAYVTQVKMAFIFNMNTNLNEINKEMS